MAVVVRSIRRPVHEITADQNNVVWLSREFLSGDTDEKLHREPARGASSLAARVQFVKGKGTPDTAFLYFAIPHSFFMIP